MLDVESERSRILQLPVRNLVTNELGRSPWLVVYSRSHEVSKSSSVFSGLIPQSSAATVMKDHSWDMDIGGGTPGNIVYGFGYGKDEVKYHRFRNDKGFEPLVIVRNFNGVKESSIELSEEFRLFHNLYFDTETGCYLRISRNGDEEVVARAGLNRLELRLREIKQFLALKEMQLAIFFNFTEISPLSLGEMGLQATDEVISSADSIYRFQIAVSPSLDGETISKVVGKKLIRGVDKSESGLWPYEKEKEFVDFIVDIDGSGNPITFTCNPEKLDNYFGTNPGARHYLKPVFFTREVLQKYFTNPKKYSVEDGYLRCGHLWGLHIDNNHDEYVIVLLGDLGRDLTNEEQLYWRSFNVLPYSKMISVAIRRNFLGEFADPVRSDLIFKSTLDSFLEKCQKKFGWPLFKPLNRADAHILTSLHIPVTSDQAEFDGQVLSLAKLLIDSLNEREIERFAGELAFGTKGIGRLEAFLKKRGLSNYQDHIRFLKNLWDLRHGSGHRKGESYQRAAAAFKLNYIGPQAAFDSILRESIELLAYLDRGLLSQGAGSRD